MATKVTGFRFKVGYNPCNPNQPPEQQIPVPYIRPWGRFKTTCTTFEQFSKQELQMRLKAEVLQYKRKHVRYNKAETYSLAVQNTKRNYFPKVHIDENGNLVAPKNTTIVSNDNGLITIEFNSINCDNNNILSVNKSSASDVPGPIVDLYLNPTVPVFNFGNPPRRYLTGGTYNVDNTSLNNNNVTLQETATPSQQDTTEENNVENEPTPPDIDGQLLEIPDMDTNPNIFIPKV